MFRVAISKLNTRGKIQMATLKMKIMVEFHPQQDQKNIKNLKKYFQGSQKLHVRVAISLKGLVKSILKFMFFIPTNPITFNTTIIFYGNNFLT